MREPSEQPLPPRWFMGLLVLLIFAVFMVPLTLFYKEFFDDLDFAKAFFLLSAYSIGASLLERLMRYGK